MTTQTLYQRVLGHDFYRLPPVLQQFHSLPDGGCATGTIAVERPSGIVRSAVAQALRLPPTGENMPLRLRVIPGDGREHWIRQFGDQCLETWQWQEGPYLVEKAGPLHLVFRLTADEHALTFHPHHNKTGGVRLPGGLSLRVGATAKGAPDHWQIDVTVVAPILGKITTYRGEIVPHSC